ncbi:REV3, partial [Symbiodinium sp. KB8]
MAKRLEHKQFALKYFANVTYGYSSASFSGRMPCSEIADSIVATGRRALEEAANFIEATWPGAKVIYGDTDSVFVQLRGYSLEEAFKAGRDICSQVSAKHPQPVELEFEKVYMPCLCLTKKRYGGMAYAKPPSEGGIASFEAKGLEAIRRDQCRLASNVQYEILTEFFRTKDLSAAKRIFVDHAADLLKGSYDGKHTLTDLSFFREARLGTYRAEAEDGGSATLPPQ